MEPCIFQAKLKGHKNLPGEKISYTLGNGNPERFFYIFSKESFYFQKQKPRKNRYISGGNLQSLKIKHF